MTQPKKTGAEDVRWDLGILYKGIDDPQIDADLREYARRAAAFSAEFKGKLATRLGDAIAAFAELETLGGRAAVYLMLKTSADMADEKAKGKEHEARLILSTAGGEHLSFLDNEIASLSKEDVDRQCAEHPVAAKHRPWLDKIRMFKPHLLSEPVESALIKRAPYGVGAWSDFYDEIESDLRFAFKGEERSLTEMLHVLSTSTDADERAEALKTIDAGFAGTFEKLAAQALNMVAGAKAVEDRERGYPHPMAHSNMANMIPDAVVEALHAAVAEEAAPLARRYYRLKAAHLGLPRLRWSDRNAPMPFADVSVIPYAEAERMTLEAYRSFSPKLAELVEGMMKARRIDAAAARGKRGGAFNCSFMLPDGTPVSFTLLPYLGSSRDVMTLAHELGHGVHGLLAGAAQGELLMHAPTPYAETASIFGERVTFNFLDARLRAQGDAKSRLALLMGKIDDLLNTVVRQIGFSEFERAVHAEKRRLSAEEYGEIWLRTAKALYGPDGDVFTYEHAARLWAYVSHFHRPFYVYGYAFGELLTGSLYEAHARGALGDRFEPLYLEMLESGGSKGVTDLLKPFKLDPTDPRFWRNGIAGGLGKMVAEAEALSKEMGVVLK